jgi:hypothetical protein
MREMVYCVRSAVGLAGVPQWQLDQHTFPVCAQVPSPAVEVGSICKQTKSTRQEESLYIRPGEIRLHQNKEAIQGLAERNRQQAATGSISVSQTGAGKTRIRVLML